jgi:hypothetical protein
LTPGYLDIIGGIESADRAHNSLRVAFKLLGSKWLYCDGQGTPTKWVTCGNSLLAQTSTWPDWIDLDDPVGGPGGEGQNA